MILKDGFKALFRGGFFLAVSKYILDLGTSLSVDNSLYHRQQSQAWDLYSPSYLCLTQILAHPLMVISARVMYNQTNSQDKNIFKSVKNTFKH